MKKLKLDNDQLKLPTKQLKLFYDQFKLLVAYLMVKRIEILKLEHTIKNKWKLYSLRTIDKDYSNIQYN